MDNQEANVDRGVISNKNENEEASSDDNATAPEGEKVAHEYISGPKLWLVIASVTLVMFLALLDTTIIVTAIPQITTDFHSLPDVGWYGSAYLIATCALQPLTGKMYSQFSLKYTFLGFLALFEVGSVICGAAHSSAMLIIGRTIAGLGGSGIRNGALNIMTESIPLENRPPYFGVAMGVSLCGAVAGPLLGGVFTESVSWRWCFYINLPIGGAAALLLLLIEIPDSKTNKPNSSGIVGALKNLDLIGFSIIAPCAVMFLLALEWGGSRYAWNSATVIGLFCGAGATLIIFLAWEYHVGDDAMVPLSLVRRRVVWSSCLVNWCNFGAMMVYLYYLPLYFQAVKNASPLKSGVDTLPFILTQMVGSVIAGGLVKKLGYCLPFTVTSGILTAISGGLLSTLTLHTSSGRWIGYQIIGGIGQGLGTLMPYVAIQNGILERHNAVALALIVFMQNLGGAVALAIAQAIFSQDLASGLAKFASNVDAGTVVAAGATGFREVVKPAQILDVVTAYDYAITKSFYLAVACAGSTLLCCWGMGWVNIKKGVKHEEVQDGN